MTDMQTYTLETERLIRQKGGQDKNGSLNLYKVELLTDNDDGGKQAHQDRKIEQTGGKWLQSLAEGWMDSGVDSGGQTSRRSINIHTTRSLHTPTSDEGEGWHRMPVPGDCGGGVSAGPDHATK